MSVFFVRTKGHQGPLDENPSINVNPKNRDYLENFLDLDNKCDFSGDPPVGSEFFFDPPPDEFKILMIHTLV